MAMLGNIDSFNLGPKIFFRPRLLAFLVLSSISSGCFLFSQTPGPRAEVSFSPPSITLSNGTIYKIVIHGTQDTPQGAMPTVNGLNVSNAPQVFRAYRSINGVNSARLELSFQVRATKQGTFTIPSWKLNIGGKLVQIPAATLEVLAPSQQDLLRQKRQREQEKELEQAAFIEFNTSRPFLFEGETVPATIQLFLWDGLRVTGLSIPVKSGDSFSITKLLNPNEKRNFLRNGKRYAVYSWPVGLTAAMAGQHKLSFSTSIRVRVSNRRNSPFGSPFNNDPFFGFGREEEVIVKGNEMTMEVRSLPMKGRPLGFQGAIGDFTSESSIDSDQVSLGDPVRLVFEISGTGNFAAVPAPEINANKKFKIGPPAFSFEGNEITKHEGKQSFEYIVTPLVAGILEVPPIEFAYFDPLRENFDSAATRPHTLQVDRGEQWTPNGKGDNPEFSRPDKSTRLSRSDLFQAESEPGEWIASLKPKPLMSQPAFWYFQAIPLAGFFSLTFWGVRRKSRGKEKFKRKENSLYRQMKEAVGFNDTSSLLRAFRDLLRLKISKIHKHPNPSSLASEELIAFLKAGKNSDEVIGAVKELLRSCDDQEFAGNELAQQPVEDLYRKGSAILKKIR